MIWWQRPTMTMGEALVNFTRILNPPCHYDVDRLLKCSSVGRSSAHPKHMLKKKTHLCHSAPDAVNEILKVHEAEERLLFESVQLRSKQVLLVLQYGAWNRTNTWKCTEKCTSERWWSIVLCSEQIEELPALDGLWLWFSNICTDSPTNRIFSATRMGM